MFVVETPCFDDTFFKSKISFCLPEHNQNLPLVPVSRYSNVARTPVHCIATVPFIWAPLSRSLHNLSGWLLAVFELHEQACDFFLRKWDPIFLGRDRYRVIFARGSSSPGNKLILPLSSCRLIFAGAEQRAWACTRLQRAYVDLNRRS